MQIISCMLAACEKHARKQHNRIAAPHGITRNRANVSHRAIYANVHRERERDRERERERERERDRDRDRECPPSLSFAMWGDFSWPSRYQRAVATQRDVK